MGQHGSRTPGAKLALVGLLAAAVTAAAFPALATRSSLSGQRVEPQLELTCQVDACVFEVSYVVAERRDRHSLDVVWRTRSDHRYGDNADDLLRRTTSSGVGRPADDASGYRYTVTDLAWHSDIRCDDAVRVDVTIDGYGSSSVSARKPVPPDPGGAYCSDYGMPGESS